MTAITPEKDNTQPNAAAYFGPYGGQYVAETLMPILSEVEEAFTTCWKDEAFRAEFHDILHQYVGRPTPLYFARRLTEKWGGPRVLLKREDLLHTGAHKINNTIGQALLARAMGKKRLMAETGAGQHGVATATAAAFLGMGCEVYMGEEDMKRQAPNVKRMEQLGAEVIPVTSGTSTLKDAMSDALRAWVSHADTTFYVIGTVAGPHPYPEMVREFHRVIGDEARRQVLEQTGRLPDMVLACIGGGSNAAGIFASFIDDEDVKLVGVEAAGYGIASGQHAASIGAGSVGILHGSRSYILQTEEGQICNAHSVSAGLDYPGVGPQHAFWADSGRVEYCSIRDDEALDAFHELTLIEGILPALEPSHAMAEARKRAGRMSAEGLLIVNLSGRGDKDLDNVLAYEAHRAEHPSP